MVITAVGECWGLGCRMCVGVGGRLTFYSAMAKHAERGTSG